MSVEQRGGSAMESQVGDEAAAEPIAFGGPMYDEATARKILEEVLLVDADYADTEDGEHVFGFDPDDAALDILYYVCQRFFSEGVYMTAMTYFADRGDVKMCRYLVSRGASTTKRGAFIISPWMLRYYYFPMYAAVCGGQLDICKVLHAHGAQNDVRGGSATDDGWTPFARAALHGPDEVVRWLTIHGALCADDESEEIQGDIIYPDIDKNPGSLRFCDSTMVRRIRDTISSSCKRLVKWAEEVTQSQSAVITFLGGALPPAPDTVQSRTLQCLCGQPGVRKHIGDFVGLEVTKEKQLRILQNVVDVVPSFIKTDHEE